MSEWITDRLPTAADADEYRLVYYTNEDNGTVTKVRLSDIELGCPWMPIPKSIYPKPYVKPEPQRWKPETNQWYYYATKDGDWGKYQYADGSFDCNMYDFGNCFQTREQAQEAARRFRETLLNYHKELSNESLYTKPL
jgi:hypothetical protein